MKREDRRCLSADLSESKCTEVDGHDYLICQEVDWAALPTAGGK